MKNILVIASLMFSGMGAQASAWCGSYFADISCRIHFHEEIDQACVRILSRFNAEVTLINKDNKADRQFGHIDDFKGYPEIHLMNGDTMDFGFQQYQTRDFKRYSMSCRRI